MKLQEILNKIDKTDRKGSSFADIENFCSELNCQYISHHPEFETRMKKYWIYAWQCTDTWVGISAYFFDDEFACLSFQEGRKCDENFEWANKEIAEKVRQYILSLMPLDEGRLTMVDVNSELDTTGWVADDDKVNYSLLEKGIKP